MKNAMIVLCALLYVFAGRETGLWVIGALFALVSAGEAVRLRTPGLNEKLVSLFPGIYREKEARRPSGIVWTLAGVFLTFWLVPYPDIVLTSLGYLVLGDSAARLVGRSLGHIRIGSKSLEGSLGCFLACWFVGSIFLQPPFGSLSVLIGALAATLLELAPLPLNDNLWIPILTGLLLTSLRIF